MIFTKRHRVNSHNARILRQRKRKYTAHLKTYLSTQYSSILKQLCIIPIFIYTSSVYAEEVNKRFNFTIGAQTFFSTYEEPNIMENEGWLNGLSYSLSYQDQINWLYKIEGVVAIGQVDYSSESTGSIDDQDNFMAETRGIVEYNLFSNITLFSGVGYRYLFNGSENRISSNNYWGYDRKSNYLYSPIGTNLTFIQNNDCQFRLSLEYDYFWIGIQKNEMGYLSGHDDFSNTQHSGYGYRYSLEVRKKLSANTWISISPFLRYWNIDNSDATVDSYNTSWIEPRNVTNEYGINISLLF